MELEQRVKVLEQEMKILKNQVQTTLLDIQEQLLASKYPAMRAGDDNGAHPVEPPAEEPSAPVIRKVTLPDEPVAPAAESAEPPAVVARPAAPTAHISLPEQPTALSPQDPDAPPAHNGNDWNDLVHLNDWAVTTVDRVGVERAQSLIMMYARRGLLSADTEEALLEAVETYARPNSAAADPPAPVYPAEPVEEEFPPDAGPAQEAATAYLDGDYDDQPKAERNLIVRLIKGLQNGGHEVNRG